MTEERLKKRLERAKLARIEAERILEEKSRELFYRNQELEELSKTLEQKVTERTQDLEQARDQALQATHAKSHFIANMSHEIRTPLNGVLGLLEILFDKCADAEQQALIRSASKSGNHLLHVVNEILDFSKIEAGELQVHLEAVNILEELNTVTAPMATVADAKDVLLETNIAADFPSSIESDALRFRQIVNNLLSNAIKFTENGTVRVQLEMLSDDQYQLTVSDTGIGMTKDQLANVFSDFVQADSSISRKFGGTGLGLSITKRLVELMGGSISVTSEQGAGTTFIVQLPLKIKLDTSAPQEAIITRETKFKSSHVLLVEDVEVNAMIAKYLLTKAGLKVTHCDNGRDAVESINKNQFAVVLMDIQMPEMDGIEATKLIRELEGEGASTPIVAMTAHASDDHRIETKQAGMNDHLTKPIDVIELYTKLSQYIPIV